MTDALTRGVETYTLLQNLKFPMHWYKGGSHVWKNLSELTVEEVNEIKNMMSMYSSKTYIAGIPATVWVELTNNELYNRSGL